MGLLNNGIWQDKWYDTGKTGGKFVRSESQFRNWITPDGAAGPTGDSGFKAEPGRYHLYISYACPWAHRALIFRTLKGLEDMIDVSVVHWFMGENGWTFEKDPDGLVGDKLFGSKFMYEIYLKADPHYTGRVTVPTLWDKKTGTIVSNESADIIRMLNTAFDGIGAAPGDYYPEDKRSEIDEINERVYHTVNNGVYKSGFATSQAAYEEAVYPLFESLDWLDARLSRSRFLNGDTPTEADWRLWTTLYRFDMVYHGHFKCNIRRLADYTHLWPYARDLYQWPGIRETVNADHAKRHYYESHDMVNPTRIVPAGPDLDWDAPHGRS
ncbi:glutathione S-transferase family protein [Henriciella mobilis]|uniref:Glutathione S-transferase family protein n=1 Tax=Henriciella mobilis TaxID=2305467 RepID=A0A399RJ07_9PROT|nr:glutathione S-transferase family protein [Henriciella mobilis]RIJ16353.1 glutathione S-transferase family protein [Henriciella mobilis]RIJ22526.1 glutathione S-transferase family protein [Henriciella mobilis]RIJ29699.1 glutathione S-transferase family protein [Henriciella mobilis]